MKYGGSYRAAYCWMCGAVILLGAGNMLDVLPGAAPLALAARAAAVPTVALAVAASLDAKGGE